MQYRTRIYVILLSVWILACSLPIVLPAQERNGGLPLSFLLRDVSSRAIGLGGAYTAVANEPTAIYYNPAGLSFTSDRPQIYGMVSAMQFGRQHNYLAYGQTFFEDLGVGASINNFSPGNIDIRDASGNLLGNARNQMLSFQAATSYRYKSLSVGIGGKYILSTLGDIPTLGVAPRADGWGIDAGMKLQMFDIFSFGASVQNIAGQIKWNSTNALTDKLPYIIRAGFATEIGFNSKEYTVRATTRGDEQKIQKVATSYLMATLEATYVQTDPHPTALAGLEYAPFEEFIIRGGFSFFSADATRNSLFNFNRYSMGVSIRPHIKDIPFRFSLDYAAAHDAVVRNQFSHHISFLIEL